MKLIPALGIAALLAAGSALAATGTTAAPAAAPAAPTSSQAAPKSACDKEATAKNLKGQARKDYLKTCKADAKSK